MAFFSRASHVLVVALSSGVVVAGPARPPQELVLRNGMHVTVVPIAGARTFALHARIDAGPAHDPPARPGLAAIAAEWLAWPVMGEDVRSPVIRWTHERAPAYPAPLRWLELRATGWLGGEDRLFSVLAGRLASVSHAAQHGVRRELWERFHSAAAERARAVAGSVDGQLWAHARAALYSGGPSPARQAWGPNGEAPASPEDLRRFMRAHVTPARTRVVLAGDFEADTLRARLERTLGAVPGSAGSSGVVPTAAPSSRERWAELRHSRPDLRRDHLLVVCPDDRSHPRDRLATRAIAFLLAGAGDSSRLGRQLVETGLVLTVDAGLADDGLSGVLYVRTASSPAVTAEVLERVREALEDLARGNIFAAEVEAFLARERAEQRPTNPARCAERLLLGQPGCVDPVASLSRDDVIESARRLFARGAPIALLVGPGGSCVRPG